MFLETGKSPSIPMPEYIVFHFVLFVTTGTYNASHRLTWETLHIIGLPTSNYIQEISIIHLKS